MENKERNKEILKKIFSFLKETLDTILFVLIAVIVIRFFVGELRWIPSGSMHPTLIEKDRLFVEKLTKPVRDLQRGDIIVFYPPDEPLKKDFFSIISRLTGLMCKDVAFIKRIVGMPGDRFEIRTEDGEYFVYINDEKLDEPYILSKTDWMPCRDDMYCGPFVVPDGNYFMMGDNRGNSQDSRFWGFLPQNRVIGRALFVFWPINRAQKL
ncbi:MAG: signal peptidase I [Candidatus Gastranaerophilales bacterium]|nr:signal peptidase I [Candidatus Gastranaerophilales bacterium]